MATAEEILQQMEAEANAPVLVIDNDLRTIAIPDDVAILGVESDDDVHRLRFRMPKMCGEFDLSEFKLRVNIMNAGNEPDLYEVKDKAVEGEAITFSWLVGRTAAKYKGDVKFSVCAKLMDKDGVVQQEFNITPAKLPVLEGLETSEAVVQLHPDIIEAILLRLSKLETSGGVTDEQIANALSEYLAENPVQPGATQEQAEQIEANKKAIEELQKGGTGGGIAEETDPTVPAWAKQPSKPTYTAAEVGALPATTQIPTVPEWAQQPSKPTYTAAEVGALPATTQIPTVPETLPNPQPIVINGVSYDGSEKKEITITAPDGGIATETDPTVPAWAKQPSKPTYTASEVGALPATTQIPTVPEWAQQPSKPTYTASEVGALPATTQIPTVPEWAQQSSKPTYTAAEVGALPATTQIPTVPETLPNPQPIVINGVSYDGSVRKEITVQAEAGAGIDDATPSTTTTYSSKHIDDLLNAQKEANVKQDNRLTALEQAGGIVTVEPADDDIPKVYFTGATPTNKGEGDVQLFMRYVSKTTRIEKPVTLKVQGDSSANYPKKNFTMKVYADSTYEDKEKLTFKGWPSMNKFVLKAHWMDHSHVRNVGTAKIWSKIVASRFDYASLPEELRTSANNGATDGFTCKVFVNGVYQGLYELIVAKDQLYGQDKDIATHSIMNSEQNNNATCAFSTTSPSVNGNWSEELQDSMSSAISTSFANFIKFVAGATDEEFVANAETYFDVQSVIDFDIFARVFCIVDNVCKNQIFFTYDGAKWYEGAWDLDGVLGNPPTARGYFAPDTAFQTGYIAYIDHHITNRLYERVETLFTDRFKNRYAELRTDVLSADNIIDVYERMTDVITTYDGLLEEDYAPTTGGGAFTGIPYQAENNIQQIRNFVAARLPYMDEQVDAITPPADPIPCTSISLDKSTLTFDSEGTQRLTATVTPSDTTDIVVWSSDDTSVASVSEGIVTARSAGSCIITATCGKQTATCSVTVNEIELNMLAGASWEEGYYVNNSGQLAASASDIVTSLVDVSAYAGKSFVPSSTNKYSRAAFYDSNEEFISAHEPYSESYTVVPASAKYMRYSLVKTSSGSELIFRNLENNLFDTTSVKAGTPENASDSGSSSVYIDVIPGEDYYIRGGWCVYFLGEDASIVSKNNVVSSTIINGVYTVPNDAVSLVLSGLKAEMSAGKPKISSMWSEVGRLAIPS